jgi:hypothetical protein
MGSRAFDRFAGTCALIVGAGGVAYSIAFVVLLQAGGTGSEYAGALLLMVGGLLSTAVFVGLFQRLREVDAGFALWALFLALAGAMGTMLHGGESLALLKNPLGAMGDFPNFADPRGLATFAVTGLGVFLFSWLITRDPRAPTRLGYLGYVSALLGLLIYLGRLIILNPKSPGLLTAALLSGFVVNPAWFIWVGLRLRQSP